MEADIFKSAASYGIFCLLFVWILFYVIKTQQRRDKETAAREIRQREESKAREDKLMEHNRELIKVLPEVVEGQRQTAAALAEMRHDINRLEDRMDHKLK